MATLARSRVVLAACLSLAASGGCSPSVVPDHWSGYVEGEYVRIAAPVAGTLTELAVQRGEQVTAGQLLFRIDDAQASAAVAEAAARASAAQAQAMDTQSGRRPDEIAITRAQLEQAKALSRLAEAELRRQNQLKTQGFISAARLDDARAAAARAGAQVLELEAALRVADSPARSAQQEAALANAQAARHALDQAAWQEQQTDQMAPVTGVVDDVYFRVGEYVNPTRPVMALLPPHARVIRFFVPESAVAGLAPGQGVQVSCDGCGVPIDARLTRIATQPEYTPPVIYSNAQRARLVFMVEAQAVQTRDSTRLRPGQPVDVSRPPDPSAASRLPP